MKKRTAVILAVFLMVSLAACGRSDSASAENETDLNEVEEIQPEMEENVSNLPEEDSFTQEGVTSDGTETGETQGDTEMKMKVEAGDSTFTATMEDNEAAAALAEMMEEEPVVIEMDDYSGFEKVGSLGESLPASNSQMTTHPGDIVLYNGSQIVMFYGSNSWSYTKLAEIDDLTGWEEALGNGSVTVTLSLE